MLEVFFLSFVTIQTSLFSSIKTSHVDAEAGFGAAFASFFVIGVMIPKLKRTAIKNINDNFMNLGMVLPPIYILLLMRIL